MAFSVEEQFVDLIFNKVGWEKSESVSFKGCIVFGNRTFYGLKYGGYSILHIHELINFIENGDMVFKDKTYNVRPPGKIPAQTLTDFIDNNIFQIITAKSAVEKHKYTKFRNKGVLFKTYVLDTKKLDENFTEYFGK